MSWPFTQSAQRTTTVLNPRLVKSLGWFVLGAVGLASGYFLDQYLAKSFIFLAAAAVAIAILRLPYPWAMATLIVYIGIEGMAKLMTNYNPVVHVGTDILLYSIVLRWFAGWFIKKYKVPRLASLICPFISAMKNPFNAVWRMS